MRKFISPANIRLPDSYSEEWILHSTSPLPGVGRLDDRVKQLVQHIHELFGLVPDNMEDFVFASQAFQAEAMKFSIESFRSAKWRRTGIIWWNIKDGWPQFSDAVVDYYFNKKMAYDFIKRSQSPLCLVLREPIDGRHELVACNDTREDLQVEYTVEDADCGEVLCRGIGVASSDSVSLLDSLGQVAAGKRFYIIKWSTILGEGVSHYLAGDPPFDLGTFKRWLEVLHSSVEQTHHHSDSREDVNICLPHRTADTGIPLGAIKG